MSFVYCPECGFQNPESANYCSKCGALLVKDEGGAETTQTYTPEEIADEDGPLDEIAAEGPALVVRSGGGRAGEHFTPQGDRTTIGRSPDNDIFLDDVTVSRKHAVLVQSGGEFRIEDLGSLNGTFVNRRRIDSATRLESGDEVQIGKYRLSFISK
ncbi:MAG: FHA domain-containing protein [Actinobacteria bacterium]|nr:MAG: FHA domain-containing protein [Actinomycetota bacterium]